MKTEKYICVLCGKHCEGYGNNPEPLKQGKCCNTCNDTKVIPARLKAMGLENQLKKKLAELKEKANKKMLSKGTTTSTNLFWKGYLIAIAEIEEHIGVSQKSESVWCPRCEEWVNPHAHGCYGKGGN